MANLDDLLSGGVVQSSEELDVGDRLCLVRYFDVEYFEQMRHDNPASYSTE